LVVGVTATTVRQRRRWLVVAAFALMLAWVLAPAAIPIYDGIGNPDEPYRYVNPPANAKTTKKPTSVHAVVPVTGTSSAAQFANTGEKGPQLSLYLPPKAFQVLGSEKSVKVTVTPTAPSAPLPADGTIVTNVYRISATAGGQPVGVVNSGPSEPTLQMRAPDARQPGPVMEHRTANGWERERTIRVGTDIYQAQAPVLGDWALVRLASADKSGSSSSGGVNWALLGPGAGLLVLAVVVLMVRLRRTSDTTLDLEG
jgi:hypothetical protein